MAITRTIGSVIHPAWNYDLEASLRVHCDLVKRSLDPKWRFKGQWVTTGPLETLFGYPGCGSSFGSTDALHLNLPFREGLENTVKKINGLIFRALCEYPGLASLSETVNQKFAHCGDAFDALGKFELGRTHEKLNSCHKRATLVRDVRLECWDSGVCLNADVSFNNRPCESRWGLFWLAKKRCPSWTTRTRLSTWLEREKKTLADLVAVRRSNKD